MYRTVAFLSILAAVAQAQQTGTYTSEVHPTLTWSSCAASGCTAETGSVVLDSNWRWVHEVSSSTNCYTGNTWDTSICDTDTTCASDCALDGADYESTYGVSTSGDAITLKFITDNSNGVNVGSRLYLMSSQTEYKMFKLLGNEFTFDVDLSTLGCGLNGAVYFVSMYEDGGMSEYSGNKAGAEYGTGYCDSQCPRDLKFIGGEANVEGWVPSTDNKNTGVGNHGSCCAEMDIWEGNSISCAYTAHPCQTYSPTICEADDCGGTYSTNRYAGTCDPDGCDFNPYRLGNTTFYGPGMTIDTNSVFTVVTQFIESGGSLSSINRFYVQNGKIIANPVSDTSGITGNSVTEAFCEQEKTVFSDPEYFDSDGGWSGFTEAISNPMALVMSLWDDYDADMLWLDSTYPVGSTAAGAVRGTCSTSSGVPATIESEDTNASVTYSNIRFGSINSTYSTSG